MSGLDALMNYLTALGYGTTEDKIDYWPSKSSPNWKRYFEIPRNLLASIFNEFRYASTNILLPTDGGQENGREDE